MATSFESDNSLKAIEDMPETLRVAMIVEVSRHGDLLLKAGTGKDAYDIKVSSAVLIEASPVFATMLTSQFREAHTKVIEMYEDDPEVVLAFCKLVHHKADNIDNLSSLQIIALLEMANMRECLSVVKAAVASVISEFEDMYFEDKWQEAELQRAARGELRHSKRLSLPIRLPLNMLVEIAGIVGSYRVFWDATRVYLLTSTGTSDPGSVCNIPLPRKHGHRNGDTVHQLINASYHKYVRKFLQEVWRCVDEVKEPCISRCSISIHGKYRDYHIPERPSAESLVMVHQETCQALEKEGLSWEISDMFPSTLAETIGAVKKVHSQMSKRYRQCFPYQPDVLCHCGLSVCAMVGSV
ncbi:hypothetical protein H2200_003878 [Cladophialophora chaetospira]|uniref:BTB domain-containing protein n=1 Tax=Cladophialophora chaetospira TaxID=386627 RepID=A0AA38XF99_9EURO|nr:hypothetical protein H2200_003878 [Cladophialophora chaetospira]